MAEGDPVRDASKRLAESTDPRHRAAQVRPKIEWDGVFHMEKKRKKTA